jgi:beta-glucosidase
MTTTRAEALVAELTLDEKAQLTAGRDMWATVAIERLGIPSVRMTDGPNGARGSALFGAGEASATCVPCGTALAATWDPDLVQRVGELLGAEARAKTCRLLLAPTVNIHRSPLAGRNFECLSEDPLLAGRIAAAYVRGVQSQGVVATVKHLAGNEAEFERHTMDSVIDERALREIYLLPFELAVREGGALGVMTSYNRLNGRYCADDEELLAGIVRGEWGFQGIVMSDWFALVKTREAARAGLDLEMPGPGRAFGPGLAEGVRAGEVDKADVDAKASRLLGVLERVGALHDGEPGSESSEEDPAHRALAREAAAAGMVLLVNDGLLPLDAAGLRRIAVIGPNADRAEIMGGGSARLRPHRRVTPLQAIRDRFGGGAEVTHERGCDIDVHVPVLAPESLADGGFVLELRPHGGDPVAVRREDGLLLVTGGPVPTSFTAHGTFVAREPGMHTFTLAQSGRARLYAGDRLLIDGTADPPPPGTQLIGLISQDLTAEVDLAEGAQLPLRVDYAPDPENASPLRGVRLGCRRPAPADLLDRAVAAAADADAVVLVVGTNDDWESEGVDRASMRLPGEQDELIARVLDANPRTVVVVNAGAPVEMPWADRAAAVLQAWFGGQEMAPALADVLSGAAEPAGRLPTTFPLRLEHNPSHGAFPGENGTVRYAESILVGYRWYDTRRLPTRFPFGHGLSYTRFELGEPRLSATALDPGDELVVEVPVANVGDRRGAEVVQCYVAQRDPRLSRPDKELKAFAKVWLDPGEHGIARVALGPRAFAYWDPGDPDREALQERLAGLQFGGRGAGLRSSSTPGWRIDGGVYEVRVGRSAEDIAHVATVKMAAAGHVSP